ncbi:MAG: hypothetical protein ACKV2Q_24330 [Planctomycetaceae bacterium]
MRFTVTWTETAKADLAECWLRLPQGERQNFTRRVDWIDRDPCDNAHQKGSPLAAGFSLRFLAPPEFFEAPTLGVIYSVFEEDRIVDVLELRLVPRRP